MRDTVPGVTSYLVETDDGYVQAKAGLIRKRAAIAAEIEQLNRNLSQRTADMRAIEAALRILDPGVDTDGLPVRQPPVPHHAFRGELMRLILGALRGLPDGGTTRELAVIVMRERMMDAGDPAGLKLMHRRVSHSLKQTRDKGMVWSELADSSGMLLWRLA